MPRKRKTKCDLIREVIAENPSFRNKDVIEALAKRRVTVSTSIVSNVMKHGGTNEARKKSVANKVHGSASDLIMAKRFVDQIGFKRAYSSLRTLENLQCGRQ